MHDAILFAMAAQKKGGASSWNELTDKPFVTVGVDTLEWDGNTEGLETSGFYVKVSSATPQKADFANGCTLTAMGGSIAIPSEWVTEDATNSNILLVYGEEPSDSTIPMVMVVVEDVLDEPILTAGVYFIDLASLGADSFISGLTIPGYAFTLEEKLDPEFLLVKKFYINSANASDKYLYTDVICTTKATKAELSSAVENGMDRYYLVANGAIGASANPLFVTLAVSGQSYAQMRIVTVVADDGTITTALYYTAEYTAT